MTTTALVIASSLESNASSTTLANDEGVVSARGQASVGQDTFAG
jgi:hypothetical protein